MNAGGNLADVAFTDDGLQLYDLPTEDNSSVSRADAIQGEDVGSDEPQAETPPSEVTSQHNENQETEKEDIKSSAPKRDIKAAYRKRNPWGRDTKSRAVIDAVISSNGETAKDIKSLSKLTDGGVADSSIKLYVNFALQAFDCMRQAGWLDDNNPAVQSFIQSIEDK